MTAFSAPISAPTADLAFLASVGEFRLAPSVLDGTLRSGISAADHNAQIFEARRLKIEKAEGRIRAAVERAHREAEKSRKREEREAKKIAARKAAEAAQTTERELTDLRSEGILVEFEGDVAEVVSLLVDPAFGPGVWVRLELAEGGFHDVHEDRWAELGDEIETALMIAYDRIPVGALLV